jgi:hypothetical protein
MSYERIEISEEDRDMWHQTIEDRLGDDYNFDVVEKKINECIDGWEKSPKTFEQRIERKFFHRPPSRTVTTTSVVDGQELDDDLNDPIMSVLKADEKELYVKRFTKYKDDFGFNSSADISLLKQLVFEELVITRCTINRLNMKKGDDPVFIEDQLNNSNKRLIELQRALGISRDKRKDLLDNQAGDIATLSESLDEKIKKAPEINAKYLQEERHYLNLKSQRPEINILPPLESLKGSSNDTLETLVDMATRQNKEEEEVVKKELPFGSTI